MTEHEHPPEEMGVALRYIPKKPIMPLEILYAPDLSSLPPSAQTTLEDKPEPNVQTQLTGAQDILIKTSPTSSYGRLDRVLQSGPMYPAIHIDHALDGRVDSEDGLDFRPILAEASTSEENDPPPPDKESFYRP